ncbi:hypothetical protein BKA70DRAFT_1275276 [Coprinopsis sp. MPI-PUGE-AT-0042]|nr:hypothetical protein BKA70DRAFT_1275276 [Coprinopsis sp. MPI-PUGE-AT-0042]
MVAAYDGYESIVTLLLVRPEIQVNLVSNKGWSALMLAAGKGHKAIVHLLLDASNLDTTIKNVESGHTASLIALANGHLEIAQLLREFELHRAALLSIDSSVKDIADPGQPVLQELVHEEMGEGVSDQGANDKQTPDEPSGRSRGAKRSRDNEEDSLESSVDDVTAPPALKRHCGVEAAEGPLA